MKDKLVVAQVGCGYWGPNLLRVLHELPDARVKWLCDLKPGRLAWAQQRYRQLRLTESFSEVLADPDVDVVAIATEIVTHHRLALAALRADKHLFVEKPLAHSTREARDIAGLAKKKRLKLGVGHVYLYNPAIRAMKGKLGGKELGRLLYLDMTRINPGPPAPRHDVVWDMAPHDAALALHLAGKALAVRATGRRWLNKKLDEAAFIEVEHARNVLSRVHVGWLSSRKIRRAEAYAERGAAFFDEGNAEEKLRLVLAGEDTRVGAKASSAHALYYAEGKILVPSLPKDEPLKTELADFLGCVRSGREPLSGAAIGVEVVRILEAACKSASEGGRRIKL